MDPEKLTTRTREAVLGATQHAESAHHASVQPEHLALALLGQQEGIVYPLLDALDIDPLELRRALESQIRQKRQYLARAWQADRDAFAEDAHRADEAHF